MENKELIEFAQEFERETVKEQERVDKIIQSGIDITSEIETVQRRLEILRIEEKKVAFYPHKLTIRNHIKEDETYLRILYKALNPYVSPYFKKPVAKQKKEFNALMDNLANNLSGIYITPQ